MVRKILALLLAVMMAISLIACGSSEESESTETTKKQNPIADVTPPKADVSEEKDEIDDSMANYWVDLVVAGEAQYTIVSEAQVYDSLASTLASQMSSATGVSFVAKTSAEQASVTGKKISIGKDPALVISDPEQ